MEAGGGLIRPRLEGNMEPEKALAILEQAAAEALLKKKDHILCEEALGVLKEIIEASNQVNKGEKP